MTTDEVVEKLKELGVWRDDAESFYTLRLETDRAGQRFRIPVPVGYGLVNVDGFFTGPEEGFIPRWESVS
jgi:hypothetical protein